MSRNEGLAITSPVTAATRLWPTMLLLLAIAVNLRFGVTALPAVLTLIQHDYGISNSLGGVLAVLPVLCFGALAGIGAWAGRTFGEESGLVIALGVIASALLVRSLPGIVPLFLGSLLLGLGVAAGNVLIPSLIKRYLSSLSGIMTALYSSCLTAGAALAALVTSSLVVGGASWPIALSAGVIPVVVVAGFLVLWTVRRRLFRKPKRAERQAREANVYRSRASWALALYMAVESALFFTFLSWIPAILGSDGIDIATAGLMLSVYSLVGIVGALVVPLFVRGAGSLRTVVAAIPALSILAIVGLLAVPAWYLFWIPALGLSQGAGITMVFLLVVRRSVTAGAARDMSAMISTVGYLLGATGPVVAGVLRDLSAGWQAPLVGLLFVALVMLVLSWRVGDDRVSYGATGQLRVSAETT